MTISQQLESPNLTSMFASATANASAAISKWSGGRVTLDFDELIKTQIECVAQTLGHMDDLVLAITTFVEKQTGETCGQLTWTLDERAGRQLAAAILHREIDTSESLSALEESALKETGNILSSAYLNEIAKRCQIQLKPSIPHLSNDFATSIIQQAVLPQAIESDSAMISKTVFKFDQQQLNWNLLFLPNTSLQQRLKTASYPSVPHPAL